MADYISQFTGGEIDARLRKVSELEAEKQDALVSGENIKTVGGQSVLGSGDIPVGDENAVKFTPQTLTDAQKAQARANIDAVSLADIENMDFVTATSLPTASASTMGHIYLIGPDANDNYDRYFTQESGGSYSWVALGSTQIDLSTYATKAEVDELEAKVEDLTEATKGIQIEANANTHYPMHLVSGGSYLIKNNSNATASVYLRIGQNSSGQQLVNVPAGKEVSVTASSEFFYIYVYSVSPAVFDLEFRTPDSLSKALEDETARAEDSEYEKTAISGINSVALGTIPPVAFSGYASTNWASLSNSKHLLYVVNPGDTITLKTGGNTSAYAFLKSYYPVVQGEPVPYCSGTSVVNVSVNSTASATAPADAKFLYIAKMVNGNNATPVEVLINGEDPFFSKSVYEYINDLFSRITSVQGTIVQNAKLELTSTSTSRVGLITPIELSQDGDEFEVSVSGVTNSTESSSFANSGVNTSGYYALQLNKRYVGIRATDGTWLYQSKTITTDGNVVFKIAFADGKIYSYINGTLIDTYASQKTIRIVSFGNGGNLATHWTGTINYVKVNGTKINLYIQDITDATITPEYRFVERSEIENLGLLPKGILHYNSTAKSFTFYSRAGNGNKYFSFVVKLDQKDNDLVYLKEWRLASGKYYSYDGTDFTEIGDSIYDAENEMAMHFAGKSDYTGGIHGDERIDVSASSFVKFFADGRLIQDADMQSDFTVECASFSYMQLSTLHETSATAGQFVSGHPIVAYHFKRNTFEDCSSKLENVVKMASSQQVTEFHAGMMCIGKGAGKYAILPGMVETPELSGTTNHYNADDFAAARVELWNPTTGARAYMEGYMLQGFNNDSDIKQFQIWDRTTDSKYYRRFAVADASAKTFAADSFIRNEQIVKFY